MRKLNMILMGMGWLMLGACTSSPPEQQATAYEESATPDSIAGDDCSGSTFSLYGEGVRIWASGWREAHQTKEVKTLTIGTDQLETLRNSNPESTGLRAYYYCKGYPDTIPGLAFVNVIGCLDDTVSQVLTIDGESGDQAWMNVSDVAPLTQNWRELSEQKSDEVHTPVYAYNYTWEVVDALYPNARNGLLYITYGLRTISPQEDDFDTDDNDQYGSVVYVNVLSNATIKSDLTSSYDFTYPCPRHCDTSSVLIKNVL
ncbi:MAG: hypothetical protein ACFB10_26465 [Salibacteraceae bacterium]